MRVRTATPLETFKHSSLRHRPDTGDLRCSGFSFRPQQNTDAWHTLASVRQDS
jgi:hypothetical protein